LLAASALTPLAAWAQDAQSSSTVQEVVVTAQKRSEKLQNVPVSITALSSATLQSADVTDERSLVRITPALRMDQTGIFTQPTIRGVGSGVTGPGASANVATYVDGFYQPSEIGNDFDLSNVSQVEVLKGPQGTLFGRNATGGAVLVTTKDPSFTLQGDATASYRSFNDARGDIYISGPITDNLAANLSVYGRHSDGWKTDIVTGLHDAPNHTFDIRGKLLYKPTDKIKFLLILQHTDIDDPSAPAYNTYGKNSFANGIPGVVVANGYDNTAMPTPPKNTIEANSIYLKSTIDFDWATLTSYTGYRGENDKEVSQLDRSSLDAFTAQWSQTERTFTQEFNLGGTEGNLNWVLGAFYDHDKSGYPNFLFITPGDPTPVVSDAEAAFDTTNAYAVFGDATYEVIQNLYFTGGIRFSDETQDIDYTNTPTPAESGTGSHTWTSVNERAILRYQFAPNTNVYASFSTGFKSGAYNALSYVKVPVTGRSAPPATTTTTRTFSSPPTTSSARRTRPPRKLSRRW
jgi:iron complex outermembrane receptor protein